MRPRASPKPIRDPPAPGADAVSTTSSPSSRKVRSSPATCDRLRPAPGELDEGAAGVLLRPGDRAGGEQVAGAGRGAVHGQVRQHLCGRPVHLAVRRPADDLAVPGAPRGRRPAPTAALTARYGSGCGSCFGVAHLRRLAAPSSGTTQGEIVEANDLPRFGPSGTYSHAWMSRADQSLKSTTPKRCRSASSTGTGSPSAESGADDEAQLRLDVEPRRSARTRAPGRRGPCADRTAARCRCPRPRSCPHGRGSRRAGASSSASAGRGLRAGRAGRGSRRGARRRRSRRSRRPRRAGAAAPRPSGMDGRVGHSPARPARRSAGTHLHPALVALGHERVELGRANTSSPSARRGRRRRRRAGSPRGARCPAWRRRRRAGCRARTSDSVGDGHGGHDGSFVVGGSGGSRPRAARSVSGSSMLQVPNERNASDAPARPSRAGAATRRARRRRGRPGSPDTSASSAPVQRGVDGERAR